MGYYTENGGLIGTGVITEKIGVFDSVASQILGDNLFDFTTFTFTNASKTGREGPTLAQCQAAYSGEPWLTDYFSVPTQGFQQWTVPETATYRIKIRGANGVPATGANTGCEGGQGIIMQFDYSLDKNQVIRMIVGQSGTAVTNHGGGGGASAILKSPYNTTASIIAIAGGGGGRRTSSSGVGIPGASWNTYSGAGTRNSSNSSASVSTIQNNVTTTNTGYTPTSTVLGGGGSSGNSNYGDGGAGFSANGNNDGAGNTAAAQSLTGTAVGGYGNSGCEGGFGGGGDGQGGNGGGGGGGYTGGNGAHTAGGGGSYLDSTNASNYTESFDGNVTEINVDSNLYHGYIQITKL